MNTDTTTFLDTLFAPYTAGWMEFRSLRPDSGPDALWIDIGDWRGSRDTESAELETWMEREDKFRAGVFVGVLPRREPVQWGTGRRSDKSNVASVGWVWGECDYKDHDPEEAMKLVTDCGPDMVVSSGGGLHMYKRMDHAEPMVVRLIEPFEKRLKTYQQRLRSDVVADCTRILRLPGSHNHKPGRNGALVKLITCADVAGDCAEVRAQPVAYIPDHARLRKVWEQVLCTGDDDGPAEEWARMQVWYHNAKADGRQRDAQAWMQKMKQWPGSGRKA
jgi:hypothetical protein